MLPEHRPLVSVVIPVFNAERFLHETLGSVFAQDYRNIEIIAVDDGSVDGSRAILAGYGNDVRVIHQENGGPARTRNAGLRVCKGKYVAFLDADDLWHPSKTTIQVQQLETNEDIGLVHNNWLVIKDGDENAIQIFLRTKIPISPAEVDDKLSGWMYCKLLMESVVMCSAPMIRRDLIREAGYFNEALRKGEDYDYWIRLSRLTRFRKLKSDLSIYRIHEHGISQSPTPTNYAAIVLENALCRWGRKGPDGCTVSAIVMRNRLSLVWYGFGCLHFRAGNYGIARASFSKSLKYAPWRLASVKTYLETCWQR
jgi:glycosyltransferase involved in cell wall biosynthesis